VRRQRLEVVVEGGPDEVRVGVRDLGDQRRLLDDPTSAPLLAGEPRQGLVAGAVTGPLRGPLDLRSQGLLGRRLVEQVDIQPVVRPHERRLLREERDLAR
jgi:hypothetical protein